MNGHDTKCGVEEIESPEKSQEQDVKEKELGESCICPVCEDIDYSESEDNEGPDIIYCQGSCEAWLHCQRAGLSKPKYYFFLKLDKPYRCSHCGLETFE